jgi:hypothetical protein
LKIDLIIEELKNNHEDKSDSTETLTEIHADMEGIRSSLRKGATYAFAAIICR